MSKNVFQYIVCLFSLWYHSPFNFQCFLLKLNGNKVSQGMLYVIIHLFIIAAVTTLLSSKGNGLCSIIIAHVTEKTTQRTLFSDRNKATVYRTCS